MSEPPKLDYLDPRHAAKPRSTGSQRAVGCFGFLIYGLLALIFHSAFIANVISREAPLGVLAVIALVAGFCTWRAIAGLIQFMR